MKNKQYWLTLAYAVLIRALYTFCEVFLAVMAVGPQLLETMPWTLAFSASLAAAFLCAVKSFMTGLPEVTIPEESEK